MRVTPDTSVVVDGRFRGFVKERKPEEVVVSEAVFAEIEHQANLGKASGESGLLELGNLKALCEKLEIPYEISGERPRYKEDMDHKILEFATFSDATLVTGDKVQAGLAKARGIPFEFLKPRKITKFRIEDFFLKDCMSVHLKEGLPVTLKVGKPGSIELKRLNQNLSKGELEEIAVDIVERAGRSKDCFIELDEMGATVVQLEDLRIVITRPPFSKRMEITATKPLKKLILKDYSITKALRERLKVAEGILVAGSPGAGKSTFVQALAEFYKDQKKIVKTMEKPRDLQVSREITQYTSLSGEMEKTADILLLVRPDYTIFDEMRKTSDFVIFTDLRLAGVGMCGVVHANRAIDACQRFIGRIELGMIPQIIDTIIFIENGDIGKVFKLKLRVKVPFGMKVQDLARPVIEVKDFSSGRVEYEIYTFGEQVVVMPVLKRIRGDLTKRISRFLKSSNFEFEESEGRGTLYVANSKISEVIGRGGKKIAILEKVLGMPIDVKPFEDKIPVSMDFTKKTLKLYLPKKFANSVIDFYHEGEFLFQASISKKASISIERRTKLAKRLYEIYMQDKEVYGKVV